MAINFPNSPTVGQTYEYGDYKYTFDGVKWTSVIKYSADSAKAHSSLAEIQQDTSVKSGDWMKDLSTSSEYRVGTEGEVPLSNGLFATEMGMSDLEKTQVISRIHNVSQDTVEILKVQDLVNVSYLYDPVNEVTYYSSTVLTGYLSDIGIDVGGVRTVVVEAVPYEIESYGVEDRITEVRNYTGGQTIATGSAVFDNADNSITITGIGVGVEVGDVITVSGSVNNSKEFTIEEIISNDKVIVNKAHAGGTTSKSLVSETATVTVKLLCKWYLAPIGLGQGEVNVTSSRVLNADYQSPANRAIRVYVTMLCNSAAGRVSFTNNGVVTAASAAGGSTAALYASVPGIAGFGSIYQFGSNGIGSTLSGTLFKVVELR